jgi:hypothetical protein
MIYQSLPNIFHEGSIRPRLRLDFAAWNAAQRSALVAAGEESFVEKSLPEPEKCLKTPRSSSRPLHAVFGGLCLTISISKHGIEYQ